MIDRPNCASPVASTINTTSSPVPQITSTEESCDSFFHRTEKFNPEMISRMKEHCFQLLEEGSYEHVVPIAIRIPCVLRQKCIISRLINQGAYREAADIARNIPCSIEKQNICREFTQKQQYDAARCVASTIKNRYYQEEALHLIDIEEGVPLEILKENISKSSSNSTKHELCLALLKKSTPATVSAAFEAIKYILKTCAPPIPDHLIYEISELLLERNVPELANQVARNIKSDPHRIKMVLLTFVAMGQSISKYGREIQILDNDSLKEICLALINQKNYGDAINIAMQFRDESHGRRVITPEWRKCEIFLRLLECMENSADEIALHLLPFRETENIILVHEELMRRKMSALDPHSDPIERLDNLARAVHKTGAYQKATFIRRLIDRDSINLLRSLPIGSASQSKLFSSI